MTPTPAPTPNAGALPVKRARRLLTVESFSLAILLLVALLVTGLVMFVLVIQQPLFRYSSQVYQPADAVLCPADELVYSTTVTIARLPITPFNVHSWWSVDEARTAVEGEGLAFTVWTRDTPKQITRAITATVPLLAPGNYQYRVGTTADGTVATYVVPFSVPPDCPGVGE